MTPLASSPHAIFALTPRAPDWRVDWVSLEATLPFLGRLEGCPQNPAYHAEGDVLVHTRMVCEELVASEAWRALPHELREELFAAALLHDAAKPECTRVQADGRVTSRGHARRGEIRARRMLWKGGVPLERRERIASLVRHHMVPLYLRDSERRERQVAAISQTVRCDLLAMLGQADARGRVSRDPKDLMARHRFFGRACRALGAWDRPLPFCSDQHRFWFFRQTDASLAHDRAVPPLGGATVILTSGMPGGGRREWVDHHAAELPVISLDALRADLAVGTEDNPGIVLAEARCRARRLLDAERSFVWDDENLSRAPRSMLLELFALSGARVRIVHVERSWPQTRARAAALGLSDDEIERRLEQWEIPDPTEAHTVECVAL